LHAFLISDGGRQGSSLLAEQLSTVFDLELIAPVFLSAHHTLDETIVDRKSFIAKHLRDPTLGEIGCALAHRAAQERVLELGLQSAAIFEDDASILDVGQLKKRMGIYEAACRGPKPILINLNREAIPRRIERRSRIASELAQAFTPPYPATAYALNLSAAQAFVTSQTPIRAQADWPRTRESIMFLVDRQSPVLEDRSLASRIDTHGDREQIPWSVKARMWSGLWFLEHRNEFPSFRHYVNWLPRARLTYHCDRLWTSRA